MPSDNLLSPSTSFALFNDQTVRKERYNGEWYFSIVDIIKVLTKTSQPSRYWNELKNKLMKDEGRIELFDSTEKLKFVSGDGKRRLGEAANTKSLLRIIQSVPSPHAEPLKQWLAMIGNERLEEIDDPEQGIIRARKRAIASYKAKGWSDQEIKHRMDMIDSRNTFTDLLKQVGISDSEYGQLTNMSYSWSDMTAKEYRDFKGLDGKNDNLRDHMNKPEMLLTQLAEEAAKDQIQKNQVEGINQVKDAIVAGANVARQARNAYKENIGVDPVAPTNRLTERQKALRAKKQTSLSTSKNKKNKILGL